MFTIAFGKSAVELINHFVVGVVRGQPDSVQIGEFWTNVRSSGSISATETASGGISVSSTEVSSSGGGVR